MKKSLICAIIISGIFISSGVIQKQTNAYFENNNQINEELILSYIPRGAIIITNDDDFDDYSFPGLGTAEEPYIIENYSIQTTSEVGINIEDTSKHFVIRNCYIDAGRRGINIENAAVGTFSIVNNTCIDNLFEFGIRLYLCSLATLINNTCINSRDGIHVHSSSGVKLINNTCTDNYYNGIKMEYSPNAILTNNKCTNNGFYGIHLWRSYGASVTNNTCSNNNAYGIYLVLYSDVTLKNNTCRNNEYGIRMYNTDSSLFSYTLLQENEEFGIFLEVESDNNIFHHNIFIGNNLRGTSQAFDDCTNNTWYDSTTVEGNWWSDWTGTPTYLIDGEAGSVDPFPLGEPVLISEFKQTRIITLFLFLCLSLTLFIFSKRNKIN